MGIIRYHGKAVRLNGLTDGLVVPTGKFKESGKDLRHPEFAATTKTPKSDAAKIGRKHEEQISNPLNSIRGAFTIDACIVPDYGGVVLEKPGQFKLTYGNPFSNGPLVFDVTTDQRTYRIETSYNVPVVTSNHSGSYSGGEHKPQDLTLSEQPLVFICAQFSRRFIRCFVNGDLISELNFGGEEPLVSQSSSDLFIGGQGGEYRGLIESVRLSKGVTEPKIEPLTKIDSTLGLWRFDDDIDVPDIRFFNNARSAVTYQGRDGPDTHDGLMPIPMVAMGHTFAVSGTNTFKLRDYPANPNSSVDRYTALEKLAAYITGIELKDIKNQSWFATGTLDLTDAEYFSGVASTPLNVIINHSGTHPMTGMSSTPSSQMIRYSDDNVQATDSAVDINPMSVKPERLRVTTLDLVNSKITCTAIHLANDEANNGVDNLPETQSSIFYQSRSDDVPVWFVLGKSDVLIDPGNPNVNAGVSGQKTRAKDTFTKYLFTHNQKFKDTTEFNNDAFFISPKSRSTSTGSASVLASPADDYAAMGGVTSYSIYEGEFFLKRMPQPDEQRVKQTIQGIANTFEYVTDDPSLNSILNQNDIVKVTETVFTGSIKRVINTSSTVLATDASGDPFNRIVVESGVGFFATSNMSASTRDEIVAIAVDNIKPFLLKGLDDEHTAELSDSVPTNDAYVRHLTPEKEPRIATIDSPAVLISAGGPRKIHVYYDAIDLTGEVVAGTGFSLRSGINTKFTPFHATGNTGYLVVKKTVPCGSAVFGSRTVSDWLRKPYSSAPSNHKDILMKVTAPGGLLSLPTASFNGPMSSNTLSASPTGDITPSPFINIEDCVVTVGTGIQGYGRPKPVPSTNTPDDSSNAEFHSLFIENTQLADQRDYTTASPTPPALTRSNLIGFDVIDNDLKTNESLVLVHPTNRRRTASLEDIVTTERGDDTSTATIELNLMKGRIEEISPTINTDGMSELTLRGRSILMDISDSRAIRDFNLGRGSPVKEIGDLGTPTVTMTLGGLGQGGVDIQPTYTEHPLFPGWKDRIVGTGNASVRNDKQASTYYASTRAITEIPLFPSMFFDVESIENSANDPRTPLSSSKSFKMTVDATMTAMNRPQMKEYESRFAIDWGMTEFVSSVEITDGFIAQVLGADNFTNGILMRCQRPSVQGVITNYNSGTITLDDDSAFLKATGDRGDATYLNQTLTDDETSGGAKDGGFWVTIGEGISSINDGYGVLVQVGATGTSNQLEVFTYGSSPTHRGFHPRTLASADLSSTMAVGLPVILGGYINMGDGENPSETDVDEVFVLTTSDFTGTYNSTHGTPSNFAYEFSKIAPIVADQISTAARKLLGLKSTAVQQDALNANRYYIRDGPNMSAFDYDTTETVEASNDRYTVPPVLLRTNALALKGKASDGASLSYVRPLELDFNDIAIKMGDFNLCVQEVIRRINMAGHPQAKNAAGGSAFDPPPLFTTTNTDTGTHMGYVRSFEGTEVESRDGERGISIVIHSTVPGAAGRNLCVTMNNNTPYPYKPNRIVGYAGITANNSRMYQPNSFPAPLPIGADGETFVPISTFRGAPHGATVDSEGNVRSYDALGGNFTVKTVAAPSVKNFSTNATDGTNDGVMVFPTSLSSALSSGFTYLTVSKKTEDYLKRISATVSATTKGIIRVNGKLADYEFISQGPSSTTVASNAFYINNITPREDMDSFYNQFFDGSNEINDIDVEFLWPPMDTEGIVFFGGGHTGVVIDISDGTANDYTDDYKHPLSTGPTGFSGFQNLHEVSGASAVLDFTNITNNDTINENTLQGFHHGLTVDSSGNAVDRARFYARLNDAISSGTLSQSNSAGATEDLYGSALRVTGTGGDFTLSNGPAYSVDTSDKGTLFGFGQAMAAYNYNSGVEAEYGPLKDFDCRGDFSISAWFKCSNANHSGEPAAGPIISGVDSGGRFWGLFLAGGDESNETNDQYVQFTLAACEADGTKILFMQDCTRLGVRVDRDAWTNVVFTKTGSNAVLYLANESYVKFGKTGYGSGEISKTGNNLPFKIDQTGTEVTGSGTTAHQILNHLRASTDGGGVTAQSAAATIPAALGSTAATNVTLIGLSAVKNLINGSDANDASHGRMYQNTFASPDGGNLITMNVGKIGSSSYATNGNGHAGMDQSETYYLSDCILSNVAVFNTPLTDDEVSELWASRAVW